MQSRKKHIVLLLLLLLIAVVSMKMMVNQNHTEKRIRITVILPEDGQKDLHGLLDGIVTVLTMNM